MLLTAKMHSALHLIKLYNKEAISIPNKRNSTDNKIAELKVLTLEQTKDYSK